MRIIFCLILLFPVLHVFSQGNDSAYQAYTHSLSLEAGQPLGEFYETHHTGISVRYSRRTRRVVMIKRVSKATARFAWIYGGGLGWNKGKKESLNGFSFRYGDFIRAYLMGGMSYLFLKNVDAGISVGPAITRYRSVNRLNLYGGLITTVHFNENFGAEAGLDLLKENQAGWMGMLKIGIAYRLK